MKRTSSQPFAEGVRIQTEEQAGQNALQGQKEENKRRRERILSDRSISAVEKKNPPGNDIENIPCQK
jgi:hypothetical protein